MKNEMCAEVRHDRAGHNYSLSDGADQHYNSCDIYIGLIFMQIERFYIIYGRFCMENLF